MWGMIAAVGKAAIGREKKKSAEVMGMTKGFMDKSQQHMQQGLSTDYRQIPSFRDFTNFT
ncbi:TPA: hypothetical protein NJ597_001226 [Vibrio parahaemolyticus]|nr:hypothetical protein [Vibrio parahaemolyticus]